MSLSTWNQIVTLYIENHGHEPPLPARSFLELSNYLNFHRADVISIDILPSIPQPDDGSSLLVDGSAVAIGKKDLMRAFLYARKIFFARSEEPSASEDAIHKRSLEKRQAAQVMLLFDPEQLTASNYLKRHLVSHFPRSPEAIKVDLDFLQSVLTSPLHKHSKSPTLWYHREWLVKTFTPWELPDFLGAKPGTNVHTAYKRAQFWRDEFTIARKAAEQHEKNVYAFQYLRKLWCLLWNDPEICSYRLRADVVGSETIRRLSQWCKQNPTDISGWTFLIWLCCRPQAGHNMKIIAKSQISAISIFQENLGWKGASADFALKSLKELAPIHFPDKPICALRLGPLSSRSSEVGGGSIQVHTDHEIELAQDASTGFSQ